MIHATATAHRVLLQRPQSRQRLSRVPHLGVRTRELLCPQMGRRCDATQMTEQVERRPLGRQQPTSRTSDRDDEIAWLDRRAVSDHFLEPQRVGRAHHLEYGSCDRNSRNATLRATHETSTTDMLGRNRRIRRHVGTVSEVFVECSRDHSSHLVDGKTCGCERRCRGVGDALVLHQVSTPPRMTRPSSSRDTSR